MQGCQILDEVVVANECVFIPGIETGIQVCYVKLDFERL